MTKEQFKNLSRSFRRKRNEVGFIGALLWIRSYNVEDAEIILKVFR